MGQRASDSGLAGSGRPVQQDSALGTQAQFPGKAIILERQGDVNLKAADHIVNSYQVLQIYLLDLLEIHITGEALRTEIVDEQAGADLVFRPAQPFASRL